MFRQSRLPFDLEYALLDRPGVGVPRAAFQSGRRRQALHLLVADREDRPDEHRDRRDLVHDERLGLVEELRALRLVQVDGGLVQQARDLAVAVVHVVLLTATGVEILARDLRRRSLHPREHDDVPVARRQRRAEEETGRLEARHELDSDRLQLPLDDLEREGAKLVARRGREAEAELADARTREDVAVSRARTVRSTGAALALQELDDLGLAGRVLLVVRRVAR